MFFVIFIPIILLAVILKFLFDRVGIKFLGFIMKIIIIVSAILLIYFYADYLGFNIFEIVRAFVVDKLMSKFI